jgi:hypothetical protein
VSSGEGQTFQVLADGATIRPLHGQAATVQVTKMSEKELVLTRARGTLEVSMGDEVRTMDAGMSYRLEVNAEPESSPAAQPAGALPPGRSHFELVVGPAIMSGTIIGIWRALVSDK